VFSDLSIWQSQGAAALPQVQACAIVAVFRAVSLLRLTMSFILQPWQLLFVILAGWVNEQQQQAIEYLRTENQVLKEKLSKKRILLSDDQRRRLAVKGKILGRKRLAEIGWRTVFCGAVSKVAGRQMIGQRNILARYADGDFRCVATRVLVIAPTSLIQVT